LGGRAQGAATGGGHTCVLVANGTAAGETAANILQCWGYNLFGQAGVNPGWSPVDVLALLPRVLFTPLVRQ
jgi:hypothetical protein